MDRPIDESLGYKMLKFMDAYLGYNQIKMDLINTPKTLLMYKNGNYYYNAMPFGIENIGATY